ncbi:MAG: lysylphosphatidylglycerol synthase domain-containing protein, partial [Ardenticatenaceae bacterium]
MGIGFHLLRRETLLAHVHLVLSTVLTALALYLIMREGAYRDMAALIQQADVWWVILALISVGVNTVSKALRWQVLLGDGRLLIPFPRTFAALLIGQMLNTLVPVRIGDVARAFLVGSLGAGRAFILGTVALEKVIDLLCYSLLF